MGARVIKTGSRAYASRTGSVDLLDRLGIQLTTSYEQTEEMLETYGIACAGPFVYPKELRLLARAILPFGMKTVGPVLQRDRPVPGRDPGDDRRSPASPTTRCCRRSAQLVAEDRQQALLDLLERARRRRAAEHRDEPRSTTASSDEEFTLDPRELGLGAGSFDELKPVDDLDDTVQPLPRADRRRRPAGGDREHQAQRGRPGDQRRGRRRLAGGAASSPPRRWQRASRRS